MNNKIYIWSKVPNNTYESKLAVMKINYNTNKFLTKIKFDKALISHKYHDYEEIIDTFTYHTSIKTKYENETFTDKPYLISYLTNQSKKAVLIIPGGGYAYKTIYETPKETISLAKELNNAGYNAFILVYRSNPYEYPTSSLDVQRSIRYLKYHHQKYQIDINSLSIIGFSAGAHLLLHQINKIKNTNIFPADYEKDSIDLVDATINKAALIYPAVNFNKNSCLLHALTNEETIQNKDKRLKFLNKIDNINNFNSKDVSQFIAYGTKDIVVGQKAIQKYIKIAKTKNTPLTILKIKNGYHGFPLKKYINEYLNWLNSLNS